MTPYLAHVHAGTGLQVLLDLLLQRRHRERNADVRRQRHVHVDLHRISVAGKLRRDDLELRMLRQALGDEPFQRLNGDFHRSVFVLLNSKTALLPASAGEYDRQQQQRKDGRRAPPART